MDEHEKSIGLRRERTSILAGRIADLLKLESRPKQGGPKSVGAFSSGGVEMVSKLASDAISGLPVLSSIIGYPLSQGPAA